MEREKAGPSNLEANDVEKEMLIVLKKYLGVEVKELNIAVFH